MYVEQFAQYCDEVSRDFESQPLPGVMRECHEIFLVGERDIFANQVGPDVRRGPRGRIRRRIQF
jgi:hypothetical protein